MLRGIASPAGSHHLTTPDRYGLAYSKQAVNVTDFPLFLPEPDYVTFGSLLSQIRLSVRRL